MIKCDFECCKCVLKCNHENYKEIVKRIDKSMLELKIKLENKKVFNCLVKE